jgi:hypothetical protein
MRYVCMVGIGFSLPQILQEAVTADAAGAVAWAFVALFAGLARFEIYRRERAA